MRMTSIFDKIIDSLAHQDDSFILGKEVIPFSGLLEPSRQLASYFRDMGLNNGDRVGICLDQGAPYLASLLATHMAGGVSVLLSPNWSHEEKERIVYNAQVKIIISEGAIGDAESKGQMWLCLGHEVSLHHTGIIGSISKEGDAIIIYTSGSAGKPKGIVLTAQGLSNNIRAVATYLDLTKNDSSPIFTPSCYAYSLSQNLTHLLAGSSIYPIPDGLRFPRNITESINRYHLTGISANPTSMRLLIRGLEKHPRDLPSLRYIQLGGEPLGIDLYRAMKKMFPSTDIINMYGATENGPRITYHFITKEKSANTLQNFPVGEPVEGTKLRIAGEHGVELPANQLGEIQISGASLMDRYWANEEETNKRFVGDWFRTLDMGYIDEIGVLYISGRLTSIINVGNEKVLPEEVEAVLNDIDGVYRSAVCGLPDEITGEAIYAALVLSKEVQETHIKSCCYERMSSYKIPRSFKVVRSIPETLYGKIDRRKVKELCMM